jgi:hypothetical protein
MFEVNRMSVLTSNLIAVKHELDEADMMIAKSYVDEAIQRIEALEAELRGTVTTDYHDSIVAEAMHRVAKLESLIRQLKIDAGSWV